MDEMKRNATKPNETKRNGMEWSGRQTIVAALLALPIRDAANSIQFNSTHALWFSSVQFSWKGMAVERRLATTTSQVRSIYIYQRPGRESVMGRPKAQGYGKHG